MACYNMAAFDAGDLMDMFWDIDGDRKLIAPEPQLKCEIKQSNSERVEIKREEKGIEYATKIRVKQEQKLLTALLNLPSTSASDDNDDDFDIETKIEQQSLPELNVFERYNFSRNMQQLPILKKRKEILKAIEDNAVVVLKANTGTGKS